MKRSSRSSDQIIALIAIGAITLLTVARSASVARTTSRQATAVNVPQMAVPTHVASISGPNLALLETYISGRDPMAAPPAPPRPPRPKPVKVAKAVEKKQAAPQFSVVWMSATDHIAIVRVNGGDDVTVHSGDAVMGYTVKSIAADGVSFAGPTGQQFTIPAH